MNNIGIIGAMSEELSLIKSVMSIEKTFEKAGYTFFSGKLGNKDIVLVLCGIGKVNAAVCTQLLIDTFSVEAVINTGVAGAVADGVTIGDVVISTDAQQHDMDCSPFGDPVGIIPRMDNSIFKADDTLIKAAANASEKIIKGKTITGRVVSGDQVIADSETKNRLKTLFNGSCAEMEGAAIAHVCYLNKIPFVIIRNISDSADEESGMDYYEFEKMAAHNSGSIVIEMMKNL